MLGIKGAPPWRQAAPAGPPHPGGLGERDKIVVFRFVISWKNDIKKFQGSVKPCRIYLMGILTLIWTILCGKN